MEYVNNYANPMTAYEIPNLRHSLPAGAQIPRYRFVSCNATGQAVAADGTTPVLGASQYGTDSNIDVADQVLGIYDGVVIVEAGAAITPGVAVYADGQGRATSTAGSETTRAGVALTPATAAGEFIACKII